MLERFKVPKKDEVRVPIESLEEVIQAIFEKMGNSESDAKEAAEVLAMTDLRGVETHGVSNMLRAYVTQYTSGQVNPQPNWRIERQTRGTAVINADKILVIDGGRIVESGAPEELKRGSGLFAAMYEMQSLEPQR